MTPALVVGLIVLVGGLAYALGMTHGARIATRACVERIESAARDTVSGERSGR